MKHRNTSNSKLLNHFRLDKEIFVGFKIALKACDLDWDDYQIPGITYGTTCCCDNGSCVHIKHPGTAATHFMGENANWNECGSSTRVSLLNCQYININGIFHLFLLIFMILFLGK